VVSDEQWIADAAGWIALTKDERITRNPNEQAALARSHLRVFAIGNQHLTGPRMAERYTTNIHRILQRARKPGPSNDDGRPAPTSAADNRDSHQAVRAPPGPRSSGPSHRCVLGNDEPSPR